MEELHLFKSCIETNSFYKLNYVKVKITDKCNLKCKGCDFWKKTNYSELTLKEMKDVIDQSVELGAQSLYLSGGEPTLHPYLHEIVKYSLDSGLTTRMITNGSILTKGKLEQLLKNGLSGITFSLDSAKSEYYDSLKGINVWNKTVSNIKNAAKFKSKYNVIVGINTVIFEENINELEDLVMLANELKVDWIKFSPFDKTQSVLHSGKYKQSEVFSKKTLLKFNNEIHPSLRMIIKKTNQVVFPETLKFFGDKIKDGVKGEYSKDYYSNKICFSPFNHITIYPDGSVMPCCKIPKIFEPIGNIKTDKIESLLNNKKFTKYRIKIKENKIFACNTCTMKIYDNDLQYQRFRKINYFPR